MRRPGRRPRPLDEARPEDGYIAITMAIFVAVLFLPLAALSVDVARWYVEIARLQNAADAAALAGVTYLPDDLVAAQAAAEDAVRRNGFTIGPGLVVEVSVGRNASQLRVTVAERVKNTFAAGFGHPESLMTATAVADFSGPAPMGSPCNTLGNEPDGTALLGPILSQIVAPLGASCPRTPQFWANVHGPNVYKTQGDRYSSRSCQGGEDGCTGTVNDEFDPQGYFLVVRIGAAAVGQPVTVQLYDPAYASTDSRCTTAPSGTLSSNNLNPYTTVDALTRYARTATGGTPNQFCAGDDANAGLRVGAETPTITSFAMRAPTASLQPKSAPVITGCTRQYPGFIASQITSSTLRSSSSSYLERLAAVFHQWVPLCTFTPTEAGDHYLQVRTDVALGGTMDAVTGVYSGNPAVTAQTGDDPSVTGNGSNRFAVRVVSTAAASISVSGWQRMTLYANANAATTVFNLVRVIPASAGKVLDFAFFDAGDAASNGTLQILTPSESTTPIGTCTGSGKVTGVLAGCQLTGISAANGWNGRTQHIRVQIPPGYTCNEASAGGCWFRIQIGFGSGTVTDVTTWTAVVEGDPVRLIE
ncbi:hypothetical protein GCM10022215_43510 [Nocardioides fonticola]|uniref:Putative Flp pilus-assembly TadG-like N-terminal domain-containing protein n=1 Tax=Nocardioides fonticola TaxID=450363 RepID=A0ABP7Y397_9ACTN